TEEKVVIAIAIHVAPRLAGPELRELARQQRLDGEIVKQAFLVRAGREQRRRREKRDDWRLAFGAWRLASGALGDRQQMIGGWILKNIHGAVGPRDGEGLKRAHSPEAE